jgi:hypothetical protein
MTLTSGLTLGQVFSRAMDLYREALKTLFVGIVLPLGLVSGLLSAGLAAFQTRIAEGPVFIAGFVALILVALVISIIGVGALVHASVALTAGRQTTVAESWREGLRFRVWGTAMLSGLGIFLGAMCCLVPGIYFALAWSFALPVVFEESLAHSKALSRSHELSRFNPVGGIGNDPRFRIFLIYAATFATTYLLSTLVQLPLILATMVSVAREAADGRVTGQVPALLQWLQVPTSIVASWVQSAMTLLANLAVAVIYFDIRGRREAKDLDSAIDVLGAPQNA